MSEVVLETSTKPASPSVLGGAMIIAGTAIGAGMLSLPVMSAGMWFGWSMIILAICCFCSYSSAMYLAEANMNYRSGASYATMAQDTLGKPGVIASLCSVGFVSYILCYAYISGGSSVLASSLNAGFGLSLANWQAGLIFGTVLGGIVLLGSRAVDRVSTIMIGAMVIAFITSTGMLASEVSTDKLFPAAGMTETLPYIWLGIPVLAISFGYHSTVPSIVKHYNKDIAKSRSAILMGSVLALAIYGVWQLAILGTVSRDDFGEVVSNGGNVGALIAAVGDAVDGNLIDTLLSFFAKFALASSFLGVALGLLDFVKDQCGLGDSNRDTAIAGTITFLPPMILGVAIPDGFIVAIGYASLLASIFVLILPCSIALVLRRRGQSQSFRVGGGNARLYSVLAFGVLVMLCESLALLKMLPTFP
ncbi:tryptophan-specific transport protein [Ferrimonas sediminum]|uniref:Aromatic amino acid permease n=1 Tax=Ferrimonas sediminum TaxID=718193 RepID=A0A1G8Q2N6_9GAMM|nr:aromatic amino acid transport family protein [Ferrimonas sediminum]SDI98973.1 tryptophan-specific transport protein [Ferrimonas sediminum]